ncbi:MAG: FxDxF family PEP-CTERM protein [Methylophilaceae bacterium]
MKFKNILGISLALMFTSLSAGAATYSAIEVPTRPGDLESLTFSNADPEEGTFTDWVSFNFTEVGQVLRASINDNSMKGLTYLEFDLYSEDQTQLISKGTFENGPGITFELNDANNFNNYFLKITGIVDPDNSYNGFISLTPPAVAVPEPEAYAMMLVGLSLMGFITRKKKV